MMHVCPFLLYVAYACVCDVVVYLFGECLELSTVSIRGLGYNPNHRDRDT